MEYLQSWPKAYPGGAKGAVLPPKFLENIVILCFERRFSKQNSIIRLQSNICPPTKIFGLATPLVLVTVRASLAFIPYLTSKKQQERNLV